MKIRAWPRSIRSQLLVGLVLLEALSLLLFGTLLVHQQTREIQDHVQQRLVHQASSVAVQAEEALKSGRPEVIAIATKMMGAAPSVDSSRITDAHGAILYASQGAGDNRSLSRAELDWIPHIPKDRPLVFKLGGDDWEGVMPIYMEGKLYGFAWVISDRRWDRAQITSLLSSTEIFGAIWICASVLLAYWLSRSISRPLAVLHRGTRALMQSPEGEANFPLPITVHNEIGDLIQAFNRMVASIVEQRSGLSDTLSLLDSMLANAPIGLVFFDRRCKIVRVNGVFASMTGVPLSRHLGRTLPELLPKAVAEKLEQAVLRVIALD